MRSYQRSFSSRYAFFVERAPAVEVGERRDAHRAVVERLVVGEIVGRADHAAAHVAQLVRLLPDELVVVVEERDRAVVAEVAGLGVERGDRFAETELAGRARGDHGLAVVAEPHRFAPAGRRNARCGLRAPRRSPARRASRGRSRRPAASRRCAASARRPARGTCAPGASGSAARRPAGRPRPSRKMLRNMIENWPQSMSCSRAEP